MYSDMTDSAGEVESGFVAKVWISFIETRHAATAAKKRLNLIAKKV